MTILEFELASPAHVGHVVADLDEAMREYSTQFDVSWAPITEYGRGRSASRFTCTTRGAVLIELIQEAPGSVWSREHGQPFHHLAYWCDDLPATRDELLARGLHVEVQGPTFAYLRGAGGSRIELMDRVIEPAWDGWLSGGRLFT